MPDRIPSHDRSEGNGTSTLSEAIQSKWTVMGALLTIAVVVAVGLSAALLHRQLFLFEESRQAQPERLAIWDLAQLQRQLLTLESAIEVAAASEELPDRGHLQLQLDLAFSRLDNLSQGELARALASLPENINRLPTIRMLLDEVERDFPAFLERPMEVGPVLRKSLTRAILLSQESHSLAYNDLLIRNKRLAERLDAVETQTLFLDGVFAVLVVLLLIGIWRTFRSRLHTVVDLAERLRHSEERFRTLVEVSIQGIVVHRNFDVVYANDAFLRMFGYPPEAANEEIDLLGGVAPDQQELMRRNYAERMRGKAVVSRYEMEVTRRDGTRIWIEMQARGITWDGERAVMLTVMDLTDRKLAEESLRRAKETAVAVSEAKSSFLANVSHELRTPMTSVIGFADLILKGIYGDVPEDIRDAVVEIQSNGRQLLSLINDVLDISKIESGHLKLRMAEHEPMECVVSVVRRMKSLAEEKGLSLEIDHAAPAPQVGRFDEQRITQVLTNLIGNAIKFTTRGSVRVGVRGEDEGLVFWVTDTGSGIPQEERDMLFEEFHQIDVERVREGAGAGLGLAIVKGIVQGHGGQIWMDSKVGLGSTFWFSIPQRGAAA